MMAKAKVPETNDRHATSVNQALKRTLAVGFVVAVVITLLMLFLFDGSASIQLKHTLVYFILFITLTFGASLLNYPVDSLAILHVAFLNRIILLLAIVFFVLGINGMISLADYFSLLTDFFLPANSAGRYSIHVLLVLCTLTAFGVFNIALLMVVLPDSKNPKK